jgi:hypothetical protein
MIYLFNPEDLAISSCINDLYWLICISDSIKEEYVSSIHSYRYLITAAIALFIVLILYLCQPANSFTPHGLVWPLSSAKHNPDPKPQSIKVITQAELKRVGQSNVLGGLNVSMHDTSACSISLMTAITPSNRNDLRVGDGCKKSINTKVDQLIAKAKSLASTISTANAISYQIIPPSLARGVDFAEWTLRAYDVHDPMIVRKGGK